MKPYIISHMMESVDGRIDCAMTELIDPSNSYYEALDMLSCDSTLEGRVTKQIHYALPEHFVADDLTPIGKTAFHKAAEGNSFDIALDTHGTLRWPDRAAADRLLVITDTACPKAYHDYLTANNISWIAVGENGIDLHKAVELLADQFGVKRLAVVGGGTVNGSFLNAGLLDEVSVMIGPGIDGRRGMTSIFDGIDNPDKRPTMLRLEDVKRFDSDTIWLRYKIKK